MSIDGFSPHDAIAFASYEDRTADRTARIVDRIGERLHVGVTGLEQLPGGAGLLVANHCFGFDVGFAAARIRNVTGRRVWVLGEHLWWRVPGVRKLAAAVGIVDGTTANADRLLHAGELVIVLPGGLREAVKPKELRYRLLWGHRYGFVRAAIRNGAPIVPLACFGADDIFQLRGDAFARARRWHLGIPFPRPEHWLPRRASLHFTIGEPIPIERGPGAENDAAYVRRLRREVEGAVCEMLDEDLARQAGIETSRPGHAR